MKKQETEKTDKSERENRMRAAIKQAAFHLMAEKGLDKVSMREIAEKVNVTKPVLYYYFKNKEDLCLSIIEDHEQLFSKLLDRVSEHASGPAEILNEGLKSHLDFFAKDPIHSKFVLQMISYTLDVDSEQLPPKEKPCVQDILAETLTREEQKGKLPAGSVADIVRLVSGISAEIMFSAYLTQHINPAAYRGGAFNKDTIERLVKIILLGIQAYYKETK
ncbi:TetR/AcrR family transcriptional regulator [Candidatus Avelusimicrobium sp.]|uniref:TetR/AcrR family transcriptional regulator n=1 Tax=Candidatus Avelusimicrobium sp. TaxID=3048833 RepID=UPI003D7D655E